MCYTPGKGDQEIVMTPVSDYKSFLIKEIGAFDKNRILFFGLGNPYRADDGFGIRLIEQLKKAGYPNAVSEFDDLESRVVELINEKTDPYLIFFADTSDFDEDPGTVRIFRESDLEDIGKSFHKIPLKLYMKLLRENKHTSYLIGVQPRDVRDTFDHPELSVEVEESLTSLLQVIQQSTGAAY